MDCGDDRTEDLEASRGMRLLASAGSACGESLIEQITILLSSYLLDGSGLLSGAIIIERPRPSSPS